MGAGSKCSGSNPKWLQLVVNRAKKKWSGKQSVPCRGREKSRENYRGREKGTDKK